MKQNVLRRCYKQAMQYLLVCVSVKIASKAKSINSSTCVSKASLNSSLNATYLQYDLPYVLFPMYPARHSQSFKRHRHYPTRPNSDPESVSCPTERRMRRPVLSFISLSTVPATNIASSYSEQKLASSNSTSGSGQSTQSDQSRYRTAELRCAPQYTLQGGNRRQC